MTVIVGVRCVRTITGIGVIGRRCNGRVVGRGRRPQVAPASEWGRVARRWIVGVSKINLNKSVMNLTLPVWKASNSIVPFNGHAQTTQK